MATATQHDQDGQIADLYYEPLLFLNDALADVCHPSSASVKSECIDVVFVLLESYIVNTIHTQILFTHIMHIYHKLATTCSVQAVAGSSCMHSLRAFGYPDGCCATSPPD